MKTYALRRSGSQSGLLATRNSEHCPRHEICTSRFTLRSPHTDKFELAFARHSSPNLQGGRRPKVQDPPPTPRRAWLEIYTLKRNGSDPLHLSQKVGFKLTKNEDAKSDHQAMCTAPQQAQSRKAPARAHQFVRVGAVEMHFEDLKRHDCAGHSIKLAADRCKHPCSNPATKGGIEGKFRQAK